jgi:hypothetical protein
VHDGLALAGIRCLRRVSTRSVLRCACVTLWAAASLLTTAVGLCFPSTELRYVLGTGAEQCPEATALRAEVARRLGYDPFLPGSDSTIVVTVVREADQLTGRVELVDENGTGRGLRVVSTDPDHCAELVNTLALTISIAIDPASATEPPRALAESTSPAAEASAPNKPSAVSSSPPPPARAQPVAPASATPVRRDRDVRREDPTHLRWTSGVGAFGSLLINPGPATGALALVSARAGAGSLTLDVRADLPSHDDEWGFRSHTLLSSLGVCVHGGHAFSCIVGSPGVFFASDAKRDSAFFLLAGARVGGEVALFEPIGLRVQTDVSVPAVRPNVIARSDKTWKADFLALSLSAAAVWRFR